MAVFDFNGLSTDQIRDFTELARASYAGGTPPAGWSTVTGQTLGGGAYTGNTFTNGDAAARVYRKGDTLTVSFRGTDNPIGDLPDILSLNNNSYINQFTTFLNAVAAFAGNPANGINNLQVTGHSLGGAAANILRNVSATQFGGAFDDATYVTVASPKISTNPNILNIGHENDWVFRTIESHNSFASTTDHIVWFNDLVWVNNDVGTGIRSIAEFLAGGSSSPHGSSNYVEMVERITASEFYGETTRDMTILVAATDLTVQPLKPGLTDSTGPALILGRDAADILKGGSFGDFIEGEGGADFIEGMGGNDKISAGGGDDGITGGTGNDTIDGGTGRDVVFYLDAVGGLEVDLSASGANAILTGTSEQDNLSNIEEVIGANGNDRMVGNGAGNLLVGLNGTDTLVGQGGNDTLIAGAGAGDSLFGGNGNDALDVSDSNGATLTGGAGEDTFIFAGRIALDEGNANSHVITDYQDGTDFIMIDTFFDGAVFSDLTITQTAQGARVAIGSLDILVENTNASALDAGDIVLI